MVEFSISHYFENFVLFCFKNGKQLCQNKIWHLYMFYMCTATSVIACCVRYMLVVLNLFFKQYYRRLERWLRDCSWRGGASVPSTYIDSQHHNHPSSQLQGIYLFWPPKAPSMCLIHIHACRQIPIPIKLISLKRITVYAIYVSTVSSRQVYCNLIVLQNKWLHLSLIHLCSSGKNHNLLKLDCKMMEYWKCCEYHHAQKHTSCLWLSTYHMERIQ